MHSRSSFFVLFFSLNLDDDTIRVTKHNFTSISRFAFEGKKGKNNNKKKNFLLLEECVYIL